MDLAITEDGDLVVDESGDLKLISGDELLAQHVMFRLKTTKGDWVLAPNCGCSLEDFIGQPNTELVRAAIEQRITENLTYDGLLFYPDVNAVQFSENEVYILVEFPSQDQTNRLIQIQGQLDLREGLVFSRKSYRTV